jgi:UDP-N-acetylglucosamine:LPS N-acetylglucosamine transferase
LLSQGQEAGNVPFVTERGFGAFSGDPEEIAQTVCSWLQQPAVLEEMSARARAAGAPEATRQIAAGLLDLLDGVEPRAVRTN